MSKPQVTKTGSGLIVEEDPKTKALKDAAKGGTVATRTEAKIDLLLLYLGIKID